jgi:DNA-binding SARP family transcriptional activator
VLTYRILGQLSISRDGTSIELSTLMLRKVAAVLLCHPSDYVSADVLADAIWEGSPPPTARKTLQIYVHRLRRALGGEHTILRGPVGYKVSLEEAELDAASFASLCQKARAATDPAGESVLLRQALDLWSGAAFQATGDCSYVDKFAAQLEEQRLQAIERHAAIELEQGRHAPVLGLLTDTAGSHPYRETLHGQLMLALYSAGRQAEALEHYQVVRVKLAEDLGIDPGPELRRVHEQILRNDLGQPNFLPGNTSAFIGRETELAWLTASASSLMLLSGAGGVGKTALAVHWARQAASAYPDGQLYVDLHGYDPEQPVAPLEALTHLLRCLGVSPERIPVELGTASAMFRAELAGKRMLLVLDNARTLGQIRPLLPGDPATLTLITSRDRLSGLISREGAQRLMLTVLTEAEAIALLRQIAGPRVLAEREAAQRLVELCSRLPLAVRIAGAHLVDQPELSLQDYVSYLHASNRARVLTVPDDESFGVHAVFARSYDTLDVAVQRVFRLLGPAPAVSFTAESVAALADVPTAKAASYLDSLVQAHLLELPVPGRYTFHDLLREYARSLPEAARPVALQRYYGWLLENAAQSRQLLSPGVIGLPMPEHLRAAFTDLAGATAWLDAERENLLPAVISADQLGCGRTGWLIADSLRSYLKLRRHMGDWLQMAQAGLAAAEAAQDLQAQAAALQNLAAVHYHLSEMKDSLRYSERSLAAAEDAGWLDGKTLAYNGIGVVHLMQSEIDEARHAFQTAAALAESAGRTTFAATLLNNLAFVELDQGKLHDAMRLSQRSLAMHKEAGSLVSATYDLIALAFAYRDLGQLDKAVTAAAEAKEMFVSLGDVGGIASTNASLAWILSESDAYLAGLEIGELAVTQSGEVGNRRSEATAHCSLAGIRRRMGAYEDSLIHGDLSLLLMKAVGDHTGQIYAMLELAQAHAALDAAETALDYSQTALDLARARGLSNLRGRALTAQAQIHASLGAHSLARELAGQALAIFVETGENLHRQTAVSIVDGTAPVTIQPTFSVTGLV